MSSFLVNKPIMPTQCGVRHTSPQTQNSPSLSSCNLHEDNNKPCKLIVDTPGPKPDETGPRKSYAKIARSGAAYQGPLKNQDDAWPPLESLVDPPPKKPTLVKDREPPDINDFKNPKRRRRTRRGHKQREGPPDEIGSHTDLHKTLSWMTDFI